MQLPIATGAMNGFAMQNIKKTKIAIYTKQTAAACYAERHDEAQDLLKRIGRALKQHLLKQALAPTHWSHACDLGRITQQLAYVLADLGDLSAVEAKGLTRYFRY